MGTGHRKELGMIWVFQGGEEQRLTRLSLDSGIIIYAYLVRPPFEPQKIEFGEILDSSTCGGGSWSMLCLKRV